MDTYPTACLGVVSEHFADALAQYVKTNPDKALTSGQCTTQAGMVNCHISVRISIAWLGVVLEHFTDALAQYVKTNPDKALISGRFLYPKP